MASSSASEAATVLLALIGIGVIVVGIMILIQMQRPQVVEYPLEYPWRGYSHLPLRPIISF